MIAYAARKPFVPLSSTQEGSTKVPATPEDRVAHALEFIASQIGEINAKLDGVLSRRN